MTLREKLEQMRPRIDWLGKNEVWLQWSDAQRIQALIDVALAVEKMTGEMFTEDIDKELLGIGDALSRLDRALGEG